ncbi:MAG: type II secretion system F family protein [Actinobacteria bacterium]|nr:type II secretion system F family protein [Actinomycetota bacterium]
MNSGKNTENQNSRHPGGFFNTIINFISLAGGFLEKYLKPSYIKKCIYISDQVLDNKALNYKFFIGLKFICCLFLALPAFVFNISPLFLFFTVIAASITGFFLPDLLFKKIAAEKSEEFSRDLPYIIDLIYVSVMSGQNIYNSLKLLVENYKSRACEEIDIFLREIDSGIGRNAAFNNISDRTRIANFKNLIFLILQAEKYGSSVNDIFRQKSKYLRFEISQKIESKSRKISVFILFPLVFLILPAFILMVGGPLIFALGGSMLIY